MPLPTSAPSPNDCAGFEEMFFALVRIWEASREATAKGLDEEVERGKREFDAAVERLRRCHPHSGEKALLIVTESAGGPLKPREPTLQCGGHLIRLALEDLQREYRSSSERASLDAFVHALLSTMEVEEVFGSLIGEHLLDGRPHLGKAHEAKVQGFLVAEEPRLWLRPLGQRLLLTLWRNLVAEGLLSAAEMDRLAMVLAGDPGSPGRHAAVLRLLEGGNAGRIPWILSLLKEEKDHSFVADAAMVMAAAFEPAVSMDALVRLQSGRSGSAFTAAWIMLAQRDPSLLQQAYETKLTDGIDAITRSELVCGMGFGAPEKAAKGIALAFDLDPDPLVRGRALLAATAGSSRREAERMLRTAISDRAMRPHATYVVSALSNYCGSGPDPNVVQEIGERLLAIPMPEEERKTVRGLMDRFTPGK